MELLYKILMILIGYVVSTFIELYLIYKFNLHNRLRPIGWLAQKTGLIKIEFIFLRIILYFIISTVFFLFDQFV